MVADDMLNYPALDGSDPSKREEKKNQWGSNGDTSSNYVDTVLMIIEWSTLFPQESVVRPYKTPH